MMIGFILVTGMGPTSCSHEPEEVKWQEQETGNNPVKEESPAEVGYYSQAAIDRLAQNDTLITELKKTATHKQPQETPGYNSALDKLEQKNAELKNRIKAYRYASEEKWKIFKTGFSHDMAEVVLALDELADWWK